LCNTDVDIAEQLCASLKKQLDEIIEQRNKLLDEKNNLIKQRDFENLNDVNAVIEGLKAQERQTLRHYLDADQALTIFKPQLRRFTIKLDRVAKLFKKYWRKKSTPTL